MGIIGSNCFLYAADIYTYLEMKIILFRLITFWVTLFFRDLSSSVISA